MLEGIKLAGLSSGSCGGRIGGPDGFTPLDFFGSSDCDIYH